jgi:hypothetical protein
LPIWDILGGTFENPPDDGNQCKTGFSNEKEEKVKDMLFFKDVISPLQSNNKINIHNMAMFVLLVTIGSLHIVGYSLNNEAIKGVAFATSSSPLPLVFSAYNGIETFSTSFEFNVVTKNYTKINMCMDNKLYSKLKGPYNRRNVFGVIFSHGPFFNKLNMIKKRQQILYWGFCYPGSLASEFGINSIFNTTVLIKSKTIGNENKLWKMAVNC